MPILTVAASETRQDGGDPSPGRDPPQGAERFERLHCTLAWPSSGSTHPADVKEAEFQQVWHGAAQPRGGTSWSSSKGARGLPITTYSVSKPTSRT